jgi:hypothetical protein
MVNHPISSGAIDNLSRSIRRAPLDLKLIASNFCYELIVMQDNGMPGTTRCSTTTIHKRLVLQIFGTQNAFLFRFNYNIYGGDEQYKWHCCSVHYF